MLGLVTVLGSWYTVDQTERGVKLFNGAYESTVGPGLGFKLPWVETVHKVDVQTHTWDWKDITVYSADQQPATIAISVTLHVNPARVADLYARYGGSVDVLVDRVIDPHVHQDTHIVFGTYNAAEAVTKQAQLNADIGAALGKAVAGLPIVIESVQVKNLQFSPQYVGAIEQRMQAEVEVQKLQQQKAQQEIQAQITVVNAKAQADATRARAQAQADATLYQAKAAAQAVILKGDAEAKAIKARGDALRDNPGLVSLTTAERWNGVLPTTMLPNTSVPMLSLDGVH
ncbi:MAG TPA: prohibitin family protein [Methylovirgula sp.]|nr:prohibitin family protein [Methylovirgula sp.]